MRERLGEAFKFAIMNEKVLGVIPARLQSTRVPEKMLKDICGKPLIERTIERTRKAKSLDALVVATDSPRIKEVVDGKKTVTKAQLGRAAAALGKGFRGNRVQLSAEDRASAVRRTCPPPSPCDPSIVSTGSSIFLSACSLVESKATGQTVEGF